MTNASFVEAVVVLKGDREVTLRWDRSKGWSGPPSILQLVEQSKRDPIHTYSPRFGGPCVVPNDDPFSVLIWLERHPSVSFLYVKATDEQRPPANDPPEGAVY